LERRKNVLKKKKKTVEVSVQCGNAVKKRKNETKKEKSIKMNVGRA